MINWSGKRRWIALILLLAGIAVMLLVPPVIPVIQLPGEVWPGREIFGLPITNSLAASVVVWILLGLLALYVSRNMPKSGGEVPRGGFYNMFELLFEGLYNFISGIAGGRFFNPIFRMFMTIFLLVLLSNWLELIPGVDSIGFLEPHVKSEVVVDEAGHEEEMTVYETGYDVYPSVFGFWALNGKCAWLMPEETAVMSTEDLANIQADRVGNSCTSTVGAAVPADHEAEAAEESHEETTVAEGDTTAEVAEEMATAEEHDAAETSGHHVTPGDPSVPWVIVPFLRAPSTDLNMTAALALAAVVMTQVIGFRALGWGYLTKFFNFKTLFTSPLGGIDVAVGLLELVGEFAKILSFSFRLLGNIFAGSILLFVMSFLVPFLPWPFFILEFFVGIIQAVVFGLLTAIFMSLATISHSHDEEHDEAMAH